MALEHLDCVVIGGGVIGLACARALAQQGRDVVLLERNAHLGMETSSRNSEVIHAGIYYPQENLKARLCVTGRRQLYAYCADHGVDAKNCGKLIVALTRKEIPRLADYLSRGEANGVEGLRLLSREEAMALEPQLDCAGALLSPATGIVDSHQFMLALAGDFEAAGGAISYKSSVSGGQVEGGRTTLCVAGDEEAEISAHTVINAAGLQAHHIARTLKGLDPDKVPHVRFAKGCYFACSGASPFSRLIYPLPEPGGLGVHVTLDLGGRARLGPDVQWDVAADDFTVDAALGDKFFAAARRYWPSLRRDQLHPDYAGMRPKLAGPEDPPADFRIDGPKAHGVPGLVNLYGMESPGLTASLAIGDYVAGMV